MPAVKKQIGTQHARALFELKTLNEDNRTVDVVFATETPVIRSTWDGIFYEILDCQPSSVRMDRLNAGAPVLDTHDRYSVTTQLGVVESAMITNSEGRATLRFSKNDDVEKVWQNIKDGIVRGVSVGYNVYEYEISERIGENIPNYRAKDWEPTEISMVPVPADYKSGVRTGETLHEVIINSKNKNLHKMTAAERAARKVDILAATRAARLDEAFAQTLIDDESITIDAARTAIIAKLGETVSPTPAAAPAVPANTEEVRAESTRLERVRSAGILHAVRAAGFDLAYGESLVNDDKITLDGARAAILNKLAENQSQAQTRGANTTAIIPGADATDKRRKAMSTALMLRTAPSLVKPEDVAAASDFRGMDLMDMARTCVEEVGISTRGLLKREIAQLALNIGERQLSTSDFPNILGNTINRTLRTAYELAPRTFTPWTFKKNAKDFREMASVTLGDLSSLLKVVEGGEYKHSTIGEGAEKYRVFKYGTIINVTWETLINDDLGAFDRIPQKLAAAAANTQNDIVYAILSANANLSDGIALFNAGHGNLAASGSAISVASLGAARAALRIQKAPGGSFLNLTPKYLIVGPSSEMAALQFTSSMYTSTKGADINPWVGMLTVIVEPRITDTSWYLAADPSAVDTIEYAFLDGEELFTEQRQGFEVDGMQTKVRMVFGAKAIDYRGLYKNAGA